MEELSLFKVFVFAPDAAEKTSATLTSGYITQGPKVEELEQKLGEFLQNPNTLALNSATSGLHLALHAQDPRRRVARSQAWR